MGRSRSSSWQTTIETVASSGARRFQRKVKAKMSGLKTFNTQRSVDSETANRILSSTVVESRERNRVVSIAVVDGGGHLVAFTRMDGAIHGSVDAAIGKARSCAGFQVPLQNFGNLAREKPWLGDLPGLIPLGGAVPLKHAGAFVGAVSVSGDTEDGEQALAEFAAQTFASWS